LSDSEVIHKGPCDLCGSSDACAEYDDGHSYCYSCESWSSGDGPRTDKPKVQRDWEPRRGEFKDMGKRHITSKTCQKFRYSVEQRGQKFTHVADYFNKDGELCAQKLRGAGKTFSVLGDIKKAGLFGQQLWRNGGRKLVVTEGEIDCMTVSQLQDNRWPVVSVPQGAQQAHKFCQRNLEFLQGYQEVVFMFDMDEPGQAAAIECANLLAPGQAKIASLPLKDPSEMLQAGRGREVISAIWEAKTYQPDGIVLGDAVWDALTFKDTRPSVPWPWPSFTQKLGNIRSGEFYVICAGTGTGKSAVCREVGAHLVKSNVKLGYVALEENVKRTAMGLMSCHLSKPLHLEREEIEEEVLKEAYLAVAEPVVYYDHFGSLDVDNIVSRVRFMVKGCNCTHIIFDHLTAVVSAHEEDERKGLDKLVTQLASLANETGATIIAVSHLSRPMGQSNSHEEGGRVTLRQLRGSNGIGQWAYAVIGLERDQQSDDDERNRTTARALKNRWSGETGVIGDLVYDGDTGRLKAEELADFDNSGAPTGEDY